MEADQKAVEHRRAHLPHWEQAFAQWLEEALPAKSSERVAWLEICCSCGSFTSQLARQLPPGGRLIAVEERRELMEEARLEIPVERRRQVFFTRECPEALSFADGTVDAVFCAGLPTCYDLEQVVSQAYRLLGKNGRLVLGAALEGSFQEIFDLLEEILEREDVNQLIPGLKKIRRRFISPTQATRMLSRQGFIECRAQQKNQSVHFSNALELVSSPLIRHQCLEEALSLIGDRGWREGVLAGLVHDINVYFPQGVDVTLNLGRLEGVKL